MDSEQVNSAKGRLRTILHRILYKPIDRLLKHAACGCKGTVLFDYMKALSNTGAWPIESACLENPMADILDALTRFNGAASGKSCPSCRFDFVAVVSEGIRETRNYFDGLCLGKCMPILTKLNESNSVDSNRLHECI